MILSDRSVMPATPHHVARRLTACSLVAGLTLALAAIQPAEAYVRPGHTVQVDVTSKGASPSEGGVPSVDNSAPSSFPTFNSSISADNRYVVFTSYMSDLVPGDTNEAADVFIHNLQTGTTELISHGLAGTPAVGTPDTDAAVVFPPMSDDPSVSTNGRYVAFQSRAWNLVPGVTDAQGTSYRIYVHDTRTGKTELASPELISSSTTASQVVEPPGSIQPSISADGRFVSFTSSLSRLVENDTNGIPDVFVRDRLRETITRVSVSSDGEQSQQSTTGPGFEQCSSPLVEDGGRCPGAGTSSISANGRWVVFDSTTSDLVEGDTNFARDAFVHDLRTGKTERVSVASDGSEALGGDSGLVVYHEDYLPDTTADRVISDNGRYVAFTSLASNLVPNDHDTDHLPTTHNGLDVFVHDRKAGRTERVSVGPAGAEHPYAKFQRASMSANGRYIAFTNNSRGGIGTGGVYLPQDGKCPEKVDGFAPEDVCNPQGLVYDRTTGALTVPVRLGTKVMGALGNVDGVSADGRYVAFLGCFSCETKDESPADRQARWHAYVRDRGSDMGVGSLVASGALRARGYPSFRTSGVISSSSPANDTAPLLTSQGADLIGASMAHRKGHQDLFVAIELEHMAAVLPGPSPIFYGLRFKAENKSYEVRATSLNFGTFGLFDCTDSLACTKIADLSGGYGTTGMRVVFSLPLDEIGLEDGGNLGGIEAFSALGSYFTGASRILDSVNLS